MSQPSPSDGAGMQAPSNRPHESVGATEFKARCLQILSRVNETGTEVTITKHGHPVAKLVPIGTKVPRPPLLGSCQDSLIILDEEDIIPPTADEWMEWKPNVERGVGSAYLA